jgi:hypothetical protein
VHGVPSLVPENWELVRRDLQGVERVLATNVASYDVAASGAIVFTNGRGVFALEPDGSSGVALSGEFVGELAAATG